MNNLSREESKEKLKKISSSFDKIISVVKIILLICIIFSILFAVVVFVLGATDAITKLYENHPRLFENLDLDTKEESLMFVKSNLTIEEIYANGDLDKLMYGISLKFLSSTLIMVITYIIAHYLQKIFRMLKTNESPFDENLLKPFKVLFIIITILVLIKHVILGILIGGVLACMYFIYAYGCRMQEDEDHTLWLSLSLIF